MIPAARFSKITCLVFVEASLAKNIS